jgi:PAS domain S-box-containing protein
MHEKIDNPQRVLRLTEKFAKVGFWQIDIAEQRVFWSREIFEIHGRDESLGPPALADGIRYYHPDDVEMVQRAVDDATESGQPFEFDGARIIRDDGTERRIYSKGEVETDASGSPQRINGVFRDVTAEFEQAQALRDAKSRLDLLIESGVGIWEYDISAQKILVSRKFSNMLGFGGEELRVDYRDFINAIPSADRELVDNTLQRHSDSDEPYLIEHRARRKDGSVIWVRSRGKLERDSHGTGRRIVGWTENISRSRQGYIQNQTIFDTVPAKIWLKDAENRILRLNERAAESMGGSVADFEGRNTYDLFGEMAKKYHEDDLAVINSGIPIRGMVESYTPNEGEPGWVTTDKIPLGQNGKFDQLLVVSTDITPLIEAENRVRESEERFRLAADGASVGIWDWVDINAETEIWSDQFYRLIGYAPDELPASLTAFGELVHPDDKAATFAAIDAHFTERKPFEIEYRLKHKTKGYRWFLGTGQAAYDDDGKPVRMVGSIQDIHDRRMAEESLSEANTELERFAYIASHDLQEPLRKIQQFSELLLIDHGDTLKGKGEVYLNFLMDAADRMRKQISGLLEYSRAGRTAVNTQDCDVAEIARDVWADFSASLEGAGATLEIGGEAIVQADPELLRRLLFNLIGNSIKYRHSERALAVKIHVVADDGEQRLTVSDNGIGFDNAHAHDIFKLFNRLHRKEVYPGTGLGLALCERVMHLHDGRISADGRPGEGASFNVVFPLPT